MIGHAEDTIATLQAQLDVTKMNVRIWDVLTREQP